MSKILVPPVPPADCASVVPSCQYQLGGSTFPVTGSLPCNNGRTWSFVAGTSPNVDNQVACSVPSNASLAPTFSDGAKACASSTSNVNVTVRPVGNTCGTQLSLVPFVGEFFWSYHTDAGH